ncbi:hypothetical protein SS50377_24488 [Spironucleus salmonicida]|uniref:Uncharacterized protein n=2 Tax=Spironucleus salmonicida TaxID=348837 RepID=A0A9P8LUM1_9EUKA|nr:hypothetical protein SS50377_24488 [Spironucleus salmonicida]
MKILLQVITKFQILSQLNFMSSTSDINFCSSIENNVLGQRGCSTTPIALEKSIHNDTDFTIILGDVTNSLNFHTPLNELLFQFYTKQKLLFPVFGYSDIIDKPASIYSVYFRYYQQNALFGSYAQTFRNTFERGGYYYFTKNKAIFVFLNIYYNQDEQQFWLNNLILSYQNFHCHIFLSDYQKLEPLFKRYLINMQSHSTVHTQYDHALKISFKLPNIIYHSNFNIIDRENYSYRVLTFNPKLVEFQQYALNIQTTQISEEFTSLSLPQFSTGFNQETILSAIESIKVNQELFQQILSSQTSSSDHGLLEYCSGFVISNEQLVECMQTGEINE